MLITLTGESVMHIKEVGTRLVHGRAQADVFLVEIEVKGSVKR